MHPRTFKDRKEAGFMLAHALGRYVGRDDVIVLALPRGGVPIAYEVATYLHAPLDVLVVRKLGVRGWEELAMGAIASGDVHVLNDEVVKQLRISKSEIAATIAAESAELHRREMAYRGHAGAPVVADKIVILVDDGIATGSTMMAALKALRQLGPKMVIVAAPIAAAASCEALEANADQLVVLAQPSSFHSVGEWYERFDQVSDDEVTSLLADAHRWECYAAPA